MTDHRSSTHTLSKTIPPGWLESWLHRYHGGHGFESRLFRPKLFQALISQLLKLRLSLERSIISSYLSPQFKYMIFHIFTCTAISDSSHLTGRQPTSHSTVTPRSCQSHYHYKHFCEAKHTRLMAKGCQTKFMAQFYHSQSCGSDTTIAQ